VMTPGLCYMAAVKAYSPAHDLLVRQLRGCDHLKRTVYCLGAPRSKAGVGFLLCAPLGGVALDSIADLLGDLLIMMIAPR